MFNKKQEGIIVGDKVEKIYDGGMSRAIVMAVVAVLICISVGTAYYFISQRMANNPEHQAFLAAKKAYEDAGIKNYTEADFKKQKEQGNVAEVDENGNVKQSNDKAIELKEVDGKVDIGSGTKIDVDNYNPEQIANQINNSDASLKEQSDSHLNLVNYSEPEANLTTANVAAAILHDLGKYNESIKSNVGWPEEKYDKHNYGAAQKYIQQMIEYPRSGKTPARNIYRFDFETQLGQIRYSIYHDIQLEMSAGNETYKMILNQFLVSRPEFKSIQNVSIVYENEVFDGIPSKMKAIVIADGKTYTAHLGIDLKEENHLRLLDIGGA